MNKIVDTVWIKRWAGSYTFISCNYWGEQYYSSLKEYLGVCFDHSLFIHKGGVASFFLIKDEFEKFGKSMAKIAVDDPVLAKKWLLELKENTDKIVPIMNELIGKLPTFDEYENFLYHYNKHLPLHNFMKKTVDFLPQKEGEILLPFFKEARIYSESVYSDTEGFFRELAKVIAKESGFSPENLTCLSQAELEDYLKNKKLPLEEELKKRYKSSALIFENGECTLVFDKDVEEIEKQIFDSVVESEKELKGTVAYPGEVTGKVRIVLDPHNLGEFNEGDILVTGMTRPEFMPFIEKASAIVTDAGGILCHAAITARELKKPCIVGTEIATALLKEGQIIKVDAKKGLISIIK